MLSDCQSLSLYPSNHNATLPSPEQRGAFCSENRKGGFPSSRENIPQVCAENSGNRIPRWEMEPWLVAPSLSPASSFPHGPLCPLHAALVTGAWTKPISFRNHGDCHWALHQLRWAGSQRTHMGTKGGERGKNPHTHTHQSGFQLPPSPPPLRPLPWAGPGAQALFLASTAFPLPTAQARSHPRATIFFFLSAGAVHCLTSSQT